MDRRKAIQRTGQLAVTTLLMPSMLSLLQSCKKENRLDWQPEFLKEEEAKTISTLVDIILPRTETPGALDVKVDIFIDKVIAQTYDATEQEIIRAEIAAFNADCEKTFGNIFIDLNKTDQIKVLQEAETNSGKINPGVWGASVGEQKPIGFYRTMKSMAIWAYFTSEEIGKNVLSYDPVPGNYEPCKPLSEIGNRWSL
ncbi:gluconate 2-dehydrogenase subunit 3 family protein [Confluentibacter citreus]|uniref:gluconate 2-dehydrogenase subunit 3 family protein n=1 Tax=Confluentibacter citreus TaxID=2007307 RepID=UPI000C281FD9|nr:gluconate 2-dehydrogenase subunit 3 family protein [Confluentibacter citreus]